MRCRPWLAISILSSVGALAQSTPPQVEQQREYRRNLDQTARLQETQRLADRQRQAQQQHEAEQRAEEQRRALNRAEREREDRQRADDLLAQRRAEAERQRQAQESAPDRRQPEALMAPQVVKASFTSQPRYDFSPALLERSLSVGVLAGALVFLVGKLVQRRFMHG